MPEVKGGGRRWASQKRKKKNFTTRFSHYICSITLLARVLHSVRENILPNVPLNSSDHKNIGRTLSFSLLWNPTFSSRVLLCQLISTSVVLPWCTHLEFRIFSSVLLEYSSSTLCSGSSLPIFVVRF